MSLLAQNKSKPKIVKNFKLKGYPSGVVVLSITGKTSAVLINRSESGFTRPFSLNKNRKIIITKVRMKMEICNNFS